MHLGIFPSVFQGWAKLCRRVALQDQRSHPCSMTSLWRTFEAPLFLRVYEKALNLFEVLFRECSQNFGKHSGKVMLGRVHSKICFKPYKIFKMRDHTHEAKRNPRLNCFAHSVWCAAMWWRQHTTHQQIFNQSRIWTQEIWQNLWSFENKLVLFVYFNFRTKNMWGQ